MSLPPFHLAIQVRNVAEARQFYGEIIGCSEGRSTDAWCDFNFYGHQFVVHLNEEIGTNGKVSQYRKPVDSEQVPVPHFGVVLPMAQWQELADRLRKHAVKFVIEPTVRFKGLVGEQATLFIEDPSGNALEFKAFENLDTMFAS
jgi:extradiol dioxygenase family protein